jgi:diguanylate cyclase (GGDEF)-like protein
MAGEHPSSGVTKRVRRIDASMRTLAIESLRAIIGILIAFSASWWISGALHLRSGFGGYAGTAAIFVMAALVALTITSGLPIHDALAAQRAEISHQQELLQAAADRHQFNADLHTALEMAEHEPDVLQVIGRALDLVSDGPGELLLADASQAHIHQGAASVTNGAPGCGVGTPWGCPAVRRGQILEFSNSGALATCPHLQVRPEQVSALCVPVTILGTSTGVIHLTGPADEPLDTAQRARAEVLALQTGARLGLLRALVTSEIAATTDSLTGQLNRRSMEEALRRLDNEQIPYAVAFADLDNFKILNDTHGHAAGDRALRHFSTVTGATVRTGDMVSRFGGEEFLVVYVGCDVTEAAPIVHRMRTALAESVVAAGVPPFTVSIGLADSTYATTAAAIIAYADAALMTAKREGRDRLIIAVKPEPVVDERREADPVNPR